MRSPWVEGKRNLVKLDSLYSTLPYILQLFQLFYYIIFFKRSHLPIFYPTLNKTTHTFLKIKINIHIF